MSDPTPASGLTAAQVAQRVAAGQVNSAGSDNSRSLAAIIRANVLTPFNALLATLFAVILATGRWQNGLFGLVIVVNSAIGVLQEYRAKRTLDRLAVLNAPHARVVRDGGLSEIAVEDVVLDEVLDLRTGDQVCADGVVTSSSGLDVDESLLSGESEPIPKAVGDQVLSGSIVVAGTGRFQATAVGAQSYATALTSEARRFTLVDSELVGGINKLLRWIAALMLVVGPLLLWSQFRSSDNKGWRDAVTGAVAALVGMVPEGLVLLTSLAFALAAISLTRRKTLVQELPSVEVLARVDVVCLDKTGTLTDGDITFGELITLDPSRAGDVEQALGLSAHAEDANATSRALAQRFEPSSWRVTSAVPFSSARKWSAFTAQDATGATAGTWVLGAPEMVLADRPDAAARDALARADTIASQGRRVLVLAVAGAGAGAGPDDADDARERERLPTGLAPCALVVLAEQIRADAPETMRYFAEQGVTLKVISGDNPRTVGMVAATVGIPGVADADDALDARTLPEDVDALADVLEDNSVFGRVTPHQKRAVVAALQRRGHVVAMTGDGVNDAMALKDADIGVAMGSGAAATRAVAQIVLLDGLFSHLPEVVAEGRRVIANIERAASLFLVKNVYSLILSLVTIATLVAYPLAPIQLSLISNLTIGLPAFVLALAPNTRRYVPGFLRRVLTFSIPVGFIIAASTYAGYTLIRATDGSAGVEGGRTVAVIVVIVCALYTLLVLTRPLSGWKLLLVAGMAGMLAIILAIPPLATGVFLLEPTPQRVLTGLAVGAVGSLFIEITARTRAHPARSRDVAEVRARS